MTSHLKGAKILLIGPVEKKLNDNIKKYGTICFALIDSEEIPKERATIITKQAERSGALGILVGGSTAINQLELTSIIDVIKPVTSLPIILFPSNITGISPNADAILFSSLLNSDDPYFIVQAQVLGAPLVKKYNIEAIPMGYLIIGEGGTTGFIGKARGIPPNKPKIAAMYALAAQYLGMRFVYLEAGSGVTSHISSNIVSSVRKLFNGTLIVGGGIRSPEDARDLAGAGADILVIGTLLEEDSFEGIFSEITSAVKKG
jgi:phosphoglycerol geranylgeranyltransferase